MEFCGKNIGEDNKVGSCEYAGEEFSVKLEWG